MLVSQEEDIQRCPLIVEAIDDPNMPFIETFEQARHFIVRSSAYEGIFPSCSQPISSPSLESMSNNS